MDILMLSRVQFGDTAAFHILFPLMSIGFALFMFIMEAMWLYTGREEYYKQVRFWTKIFVLTFAVGVASGLPLSLEFGMNWAGFAASAGSFFGNLLGFETTVAFTLETAFLGIVVFGWNRVSKTVHLISTFLVLFGASLSAFWIIAANSWMQVPLGVHLEAGKVIVDSYPQAIFNPATLTSYAHMWLACVETSMFLIAGLSAWRILRDTRREMVQFFTRSFQYAVMVALIVAPLQIIGGDMLGLVVAKYQPEKLAAIELHWDTNAPGTGAPWSVLAWPGDNGNAFNVTLPSALSLLVTHSTTGTVPGLNDFPVATRPTPMESVVSYYSFRLMMLIGVLLTILAATGVWYWHRGRLGAATIISHRRFLWLWVAAIPLGFIATEAGWMTREIGRQPWVIYHLMTRTDALSSNLSTPVLWFGIGALNALYVILMTFFIYFVVRLLKAGPTNTSPSYV